MHQNKAIPYFYCYSDRAKDKNYCDVTIKVDEKEYPAHKCVLGSLSDFFHRMFTTEVRLNLMIFIFLRCSASLLVYIRN